MNKFILYQITEDNTVFIKHINGTDYKRFCTLRDDLRQETAKQSLRSFEYKDQRIWEFPITAIGVILGKTTGLEGIGIETVFDFETKHSPFLELVQSLVSKPAIDPLTQVPTDVLSVEDIQYIKKFFPLIYDYQLVGIGRMLTPSPGIILGDEMRMGKSLMLIGMLALMAKRLGRAPKVLILAPLNGALAWCDELEKWGVTHYLRIAKNTDYQYIPEHHIYITNYDRMRLAYAQIPEDLDVIICDEGHIIRNHQAKWHKAIAYLRGNKSSHTKRLIYVSGTPVQNSPEDFCAALSLIDPENFGMDKRRVRNTKNPGGRPFLDRYYKDGIPTYEEECHELFKRYAIRRTRAEVGFVAPPQTTKVIRFEMNPLEEIQYQKAQDDFFEYLYAEYAKRSNIENPYEKAENGSQYAMVELNKLRELIGRLKARGAIEYAKEFLENNPDHKLVIFVYQPSVARRIANALPQYRPVTYTGNTTVEDKQEAVRSFCEDFGTRVFIGTLRACGTALTLRPKEGSSFYIDETITVEFDWNPAIHAQADARIVKGAQDTRGTVATRIVAKGTVDETMLSILTHKLAISDAIVKGEFAEVDESGNTMVQDFLNEMESRILERT